MHYSEYFRNFARILSFSLYKGSLGSWRKMGLRIGNRTQFHILPPKGRSVASQSATNCSMRSALPLAFYGAKLLNLFQSGVYFPEKNAAALRGAQRLRCVESMGTGCLMWIPKLNQNLSPWLQLSVPDIAAAALIAYANLLAAVEAGGADATCLADYQQVCLIL